MSKEQRFHKLIQEQEADEKENLWNKIDQQTEKSEQVELGGGVIAKKRTLSKQNIIFCAAALLIVVVGIILICRYVSPGNKDDGFRYCEFGDYYSVESVESISDYAAANDLNLLYFNWYEESLYYSDLKFKLNTTDEVICLYEKLIDENELQIEQYITEKNTQIDFLNGYAESCNNKKTVKSVDINYKIMTKSTFVCFSYLDYNYYLKLESDDENYMLALLEDLIK